MATTDEYAAIFAEVDRLIAMPGIFTTSARAALVIRAALVALKHREGAEHAAETCYALGDEMVDCLPPMPPTRLSGGLTGA